MEELNWKYWYTDVDKDKNQYTYEECNRIGPVDAKYVKSSNKDFNGNPFIEALPRPRDGKELIKAYTCPIPAVDMGELDDMTINEQKETVLSLKRLRLCHFTNSLNSSIMMLFQVPTCFERCMYGTRKTSNSQSMNKQQDKSSRCVARLKTVLQLDSHCLAIQDVVNPLH